ncbi:restriction endonuclease subunit S [Rhizobium sp. BK251]|uniref:restriction endonuclease subunit S n=1 Tax=Rhizobium sp. BK251 TaxID=2512125 RepID=UPI001049268D|nr:restriction endonuclease subunit S [Rhizobium sp. BK251]TCL65741.1 type I restriction enzyme S subunit [Rhizobium sp. BK251]
MNLPKNWTTCKFQDLLAPDPNSIADGPFGSALKSSDYTESGCRVIRLNNIGAGAFVDDNKAFIDLRRFESLRRHEARAGDLITAALGDPLGRTCQVPDGIGPAIVKADCFRSRLHDRVSASLIMHWLNSPALRRYFSDNGKGVGRIRITLSALRSAQLPLPPEHEQRELAIRLDALVGRARSAKAEAISAYKASQALRMSALRAGVTGELSSRWRANSRSIESAQELVRRVAEPEPSRGGRKATDKTIAGVAAIAVNNPGSELPRGWAWISLLRLARQETGHTPSRQHSEYWGGGINWLGIRDARKHHGAVIDRTAQTITAAGLEASSARILPAQTVCLSRTASVGYVTILGQPMATSQDFATWTCSPALLPEFLMYALMAEGKALLRFGRGTTHTTIYFPELRAFHIALPPIEEQHEIVARIRRLLHHADVLATEADRAARVADDLVSRAVAHAMAGGFRTTSSKGSASELLAQIADDRSMQAKALKSMPKVRDQSNVRSLDNMGSTQNIVSGLGLVAAIVSSGGKMRADALWQQSGLPIEEFYRLLRDEIAAGRVRESGDKEHLVAH